MTVCDSTSSTRSTDGLVFNVVNTTRRPSGEGLGRAISRVFALAATNSVFVPSRRARNRQ
jgi:hypothetical protein